MSAQERLKKYALSAMRIVVSVGLLVWLLRTIDLAVLLRKLSSAKIGWLVAALLVNSAANILGALRWKLLLQSQGRELSIPFLFNSYLVGLFFNNFLPSTIGGDVVRAVNAKKKGGGSLTENLTVVLVERLIGLLATLTLGGVAALTGAAHRIDPRVDWALGAALLASVLGLYLALSARVRRFTLTYLGRLPFHFVRNTIGKMLAAFELFSKARSALAANFFLSLIFQFVLIIHFWVIQFAFGESVPFLTFVVVVPLVFCVMLLPIGLNGLGVRESAFVWFLTRAGMEPASALALSLASYAIAVAQGLLGAGVHLTRAMRGARESGSSTEPTAAAPEL